MRAKVTLIVKTVIGASTEERYVDARDYLLRSFRKQGYEIEIEEEEWLDAEPDLVIESETRLIRKKRIT